MSNDGSTYAPSVRTEDDDDVAMHNHRGTFQKSKNFEMPIDDHVKVVVGRKVYKLGPVIGVSDDGVTAKVKAKRTKKIVAKLFKFAGLLTTDGKVAFNRALAQCLNLRKVPGQYADDATTWAPKAHNVQLAERVIAAIQGHWDAQLSVHLKVALNLSNDKLDRIRAGLSFDCSVAPDGQCVKKRKLLRVPGVKPEHELRFPVIAGSCAAHTTMVATAEDAGMTVGTDGSVVVPIYRSIENRVAELNPDELDLQIYTSRIRRGSGAGPEVPAATKRMRQRVEFQITADGANGDRKKKYIQCCLRPMPDPDGGFGFASTPNSPQSLDLVLLYCGSESYAEWKRQTEECRKQMDHVIKHHHVSNFGIDNGPMIQVPVAFSFGADMALLQQEMGIYSYNWCMWCQSHKDDWGVTLQADGSYAVKNFKLWTTLERIHAAHCLADGETEATCSFCALLITREVDRESRETAETCRTEGCGGQIIGRPPVFTAIENKRKRACFLHLLLRIVAIMFKYLILPSIANEATAKAVMEFLEKDLKCYRPKITAVTKNICMEIMQVISFKGQESERLLARWDDLSNLVLPDSPASEQIVSNVLGEPCVVSPRAMSISSGKKFREYYAEAARRCPSKQERKDKGRRLHALGTAWTLEWTRAGLGHHITPYIHTLVCGIPLQSLDVDLIDHSGQAVEHSHQIVKAVPTNNQIQPDSDEPLVQDAVGTGGKQSRRQNRGAVGCVQQKGVALAAMMELRRDSSLPPSKATRTRERRQSKEGHLDYDQKSDWQSHTDPERVQELQEQYNLTGWWTRCYVRRAHV